MTMSKRVSVIIDDDLDRKIKSLQTKRIHHLKKHVSFSKVLNDTMRKGLK